MAAGAAFLFHRLDGSADTAAQPESTWPDHPFGPAVQLHRPTLPGLPQTQAGIAQYATPPPMDDFPPETNNVKRNFTELKPTALLSAMKSANQEPREKVKTEIIPPRPAETAETLVIMQPEKAPSSGMLADGPALNPLDLEGVAPTTRPNGQSETRMAQVSVSTPAARQIMNGKPVLYRDAKTALTIPSSEFHEKLLCDGIVFNLGDACAYSCKYCYVGANMWKIDKPIVAGHYAREVTPPDFSCVVIRRRNAIELLKRQLVDAKGNPIYVFPNDNRVVFSSTLVDVAANMELLLETAAACLLILQLTNWQIRLLSKSPLLKLLIEHEMIPKEYHHRLILGFSIGTLDDKVAAAIERNTGLVSQRLKALHWLQDHGIRTFGMICPSLPQEDYDGFSREICAAIRVDRCEHVWAEVINVRGDSLAKTLGALRDAGLDAEAKRLEAVFGPKAKGAWEEYARSTFMAHTSNVPAAKLRFLQYITPKTAGWWKDQIHSGAVLLGKGAKETALTNTPEPAAFTEEPLTAKKQRPSAGSQALTPDDIHTSITKSPSNT